MQFYTYIPSPTNTPTGSAVIHTPTSFLSTIEAQQSQRLTPTPDPPRPFPTQRTETIWRTIQYGDTLGNLSRQYLVSIDKIMELNGLVDRNILSVGDVIEIPPANSIEQGDNFKIIPDSELVYGPLADLFDIHSFVESKGGFLSNYHEIVDDVRMSGSEIIQTVAELYSINPKLLLALLELQSEWVSNPNPESDTIDYPLEYYDASKIGLYKQLAWASNELNRGYYLWRVNGVHYLVLADSELVALAPTINAGTAGVQYLLSNLYGKESWDYLVSDSGLFQIYLKLFGYPFVYSIDPLIPPDLIQPDLQLPIISGVRWIFTGGPHGGWDSGSAWAALDFTPYQGSYGCFMSSDWVVAVADGFITRVEHGIVVEDLEGDGYEHLGWSVLYLHIGTEDKVSAGTYVEAGDKIGHPSCEGGYSTGTHLHIARRYNGEWIPADGDLPFIMDGWTSTGDGIEYNGFLDRPGQRIEACECRLLENSIIR